MSGSDTGKPMAVIEQYSNWGNWDRLDGKIIEDGESLLVGWPDGTTSVVVVKVVEGSFAVNDHGHDSSCDDVRAYAVESIRGVEVLVPLVWLRAQRVRVA